MSDCSICVEKYNKSNHKPVKCEYCAFTSCHECVKTYLLTQPEPHCMDSNCGRTWTRKFMTQNLTKSFLSHEYKEHCEQVLFDTERALFPVTQVELERENNLKRILQEVDNVKAECNRRLIELETEYRRVRYGNRAEPEPEKATVVNPCIYDNCRGYMSSRWKCGVCERYACAKCHKPKSSHDDTEHTCNPDDVASVDAIRRETKSCPKCHTHIYKIYGCDQMWCTNCNTAFSWATGRAVTGIVHNPHYFEYLNRNGLRDEQPREPANQGWMNQARGGCHEIGVPNIIPRDVSQMIDSTLSGENRKIAERLKMITRYIHHIRLVEIPEQVIHDVQDVNREKRKDYLGNKITVEEFRRYALSRMKANQRLTEVRQVFDMVLQTLSDIYYRMVDYIKRNLSVNIKPEVLIGFEKEMDGVRDYANECIQEINRAYTSTSKKVIAKDFVLFIEKERTTGCRECVL